MDLSGVVCHQHQPAAGGELGANLVEIDEAGCGKVRGLGVGSGAEVPVSTGAEQAGKVHFGGRQQNGVQRVVAEERSPLAQSKDLWIALRRPQGTVGGSQRFGPGDQGALVQRIGLDRSDVAEIPDHAVRNVQPIVADDQQGIAGIELGCGAGQIHLGLLAQRKPGNAGLHGQRIPVGFGQNVG